MNIARPKNIFAAGIAIVAILLFSTTLVHAAWYAPDTGIQPPASSASGNPAVSASLPARLIIPALNINANVQRAGVNASGNMQAPTNFTDVAWYADGTVPGKVGSAVIAGHVDNGLGLDGVFKHIDELKVGDDIYVQTEGGTKLHFVVSDIEVYPYQSVPLGMLFSRDDTARLNLITCEGTWVPGGDTYDHRIVIYTTLVQ